MTDDWQDRIHCADSRDLSFIPSNSVSLTVTSPIYRNAGVEYDGVTDCLDLGDYTSLHFKVWQECFRVTEPGGRIAVVVANTGRNPYERLDSLHADLLTCVGFTDRGTVIWHKGPVFGTAWGSWRRPTAPQLRDQHEYILVLQKHGKKKSCGMGDISSDEFTTATQSIWDIQPASAKRSKHPAPFPLEIPKRLIKLYTYPGDIVLDPFVGCGTTCLAASELGRRWVGVDVVESYCRLAETNLVANGGG